MPLAHLVDPFKQVNLLVNNVKDNETIEKDRNASNDDMLVDEEVEEAKEEHQQNLQEIDLHEITRPGCEKVGLAWNLFYIMTVVKNK